MYNLLERCCFLGYIPWLDKSSSLIFEKYIARREIDRMKGSDNYSTKATAVEWMQRFFRRSNTMVSKLVIVCMLTTTLLTGLFTSSGSVDAAEAPAALSPNPSSEAGHAAPTGIKLSDVSDSYAKTEIEALVEAGIISGYQDGSFAPRKSMSRAELAKIITLSLSLQEASEEAAPFTDVEKGSWYRGYVGALVKAGITQGTSTTTFSPNAEVSREELVVFFLRAMGLEKQALQTVNYSLPFTDTPSISSWAVQHVALAYTIGFINGIENENGSIRFAPGDSAERQALARLAYEFYKKRPDYVKKAEALKVTEPKKEEAPQPAAGGGGGGGGGGGYVSPPTSEASARPTAVAFIGLKKIEVSFNQAAGTQNAEHFVLQTDGHIPTVVGVEAKTGSNSVAVLTLDTQLQLDNSYKLYYKGQDTGLVFVTPTAAAVLDNGMTYEGDLTISHEDASSLAKINAKQEFGPASGQAVVTGTLTLDPGADKDVLLRNVSAGAVNVKSGASESIKFKNVRANELRVTASLQANPVRIIAEEGTAIEKTVVKSKVKLKTTSDQGTLGDIGIILDREEKIELEGSFKGTISTQPGTYKANLEFAPNTKVERLDLQGATALTGDANALKDTKIELGESAEVKVESDSLRNVLKESAIRNANSAVNALPAADSLTEYTEALKKSTDSAKGLVHAAKAFGATDASFTEGQLAKLGQVDSTVKRLELELQEALSVALAGQLIRYSQPDSQVSVTKDVELTEWVELALPAYQNKQATAKWTSDQMNMISIRGKVNRPAAGQPDQRVKLTVELKKEGQSVTADFELTVKSVSADSSNELAIGSASFSNISSTNERVTFKEVLVGLTQAASDLQNKNGIYQLLIGNDWYSLELSLAGETNVIPIEEAVFANSGKTSIKLKPASRDYAYGQLFDIKLYRLDAAKTLVSVKNVMAGTAPLDVQIEDKDTNAGVDGRDFSITWKPSTWDQAQKQDIYIVPAGVQVDRSKQTAVVSFANNTVNAWTGNEATRDSLGQPLEQREYSIYVYALSADERSYSARGYIFAPNGLRVVSNSPTTTFNEDETKAQLRNLQLTFAGPINEFNKAEDGTFTVDVEGVSYKLELMNSETKNAVSITNVVKYAERSVRLHVNQDMGQLAQVYNLRLYTGSNTARPAYQTTIRVAAEPTLLRVKNDDTHAGVDGRDFTVVWSPSLWKDAVKQQIYILPKDVPFTGNAGFTPVAEFTDLTKSYWIGDESTKDSLGQALDSIEYRIYLVAVASTNSSIGRSVLYTPSVIKSVEPVAGMDSYENDQLYLNRLNVSFKSPVSLSPNNGYPYYEYPYGRWIYINNIPHEVNIRSVSNNQTSMAIVGDIVQTGNDTVQLYSYISAKPGQEFIVELRALNGATAGSLKFVAGLTPSNLTVSDSDNNPGVDGRDFSISWVPSGWKDAVEQRIYLLPAFESLDKSKHKPVAVFVDQTTRSWTGTEASKDSAGNALMVQDYVFYVEAANRWNSSYRAQLKFKPELPAVMKPMLDGTIRTDLLPVRGWTDPGASVVVLDADQRQVGFGYGVYDTGRFELMIYPNTLLEANDELRLISRIPGRLDSEPLVVKVQASLNPTVLSSVTNNVYEDGGYISNVINTGIVTAINEKGKTLASSYVNPNNQEVFLYSQSKENMVEEGLNLTAGEQLYVIARQEGKGTSSRLPITVQPKQGKAATPGNVTGAVYAGVESMLFVETEPFTTLQVKKADGTVVGQGDSYKSQGYVAVWIRGYSLQPGESLWLYADAYGKDPSDPRELTVTSSLRTAKPTVMGAVYADGGYLDIVAELPSDIRVTNESGKELFILKQYSGYGPVRVNFTEQHQLVTGETLYITAQQYPVKRISEAVPVTVKAETGKTSKPSVSGDIQELNGMVYGEAELGATIIIRRADGLLLKKMIVDNGHFIVDTSGLRLRNGDVIFVYADAVGKTISEPLSITIGAAAVTAKPIVNSLENIFSEAQTISGQTESNATVYVRTSTQVFSVQADSSGVFQISRYASLTPGDVVRISAKAPGKREGDSVSGVVNPTTVQTRKPEMEVLLVYPDGIRISGRATLDTRVELSKPNSSWKFNNDQTFYGSEWFHFLRTEQLPLQAGDQLKLIAKEPGKLTSEALPVTVGAIAGKTALPTLDSVITDQTRSITGTSVPYTWVRLKHAAGNVVQTRFVLEDGRFRFDLYDPMSAGMDLVITADEIGKAESDPVPVKVSAAPQTATPVATKAVVYPNGMELNISTEPNANIKLSNSNGSRFWTWTATSAGKVSDVVYHLDMNGPLLQPGEVLTLIAQAPEKGTSTPVEVVVLPLQGKSTAPSVIGSVYEMDNYINVLAQPYSKVTLTRTNGTISTSTLYSYNQVTMYVSNLSAGEVLQFTTQELGRGESNPVTITVMSKPSAAKPTVTGNVYEDGYYLTGKTNAYTNVVLRHSISKAIIGGTYSDYYGDYVLVNTNALLTPGAAVEVVAKGGSNNLKDSEPVVLTVLPVTLKTATPTVNGSVYENTAYISGTAEGYSELILKKTDGTTIAKTNADQYGNYYMYFSLSNASLFGLNQVTVTADTYGKLASDPRIIPVITLPSVTKSVYGVGTAQHTVSQMVYGQLQDPSAANSPSNRYELTLNSTNGMLLMLQLGGSNIPYDVGKLILTYNGNTMGTGIYVNWTNQYTTVSTYDVYYSVPSGTNFELRLEGFTQYMNNQLYKVEPITIYARKL
jgi:hypothetical protein